MKSKFLNVKASLRPSVVYPIVALLFFSVFRPVFYWDSPVIARGSDLVVLLLGVGLVCLIGRFSRSVIRGIIPYCLYFLVMIASIFAHYARGLEVVFLDFVELSRPLYWIVGVVLGYVAISRGEDRDFKFLIGSVVLICVVNSIVCWMMYLWREPTMFLSQMYNVPNLYLHGRPGGVVYTHTEYVALNVLGIFCLILLRTRYWRSISLFLAVSCILPESKAGLILLAVFAFFSFWATIPLRKSVPLAILLIPGFSLALFVGGPLFEQEYPYIYYGFLSLLKLFSDSSSAMADGSVGPRAMQWIVTWQRMWSDPAILLFGNSPMRAYPEVSYIESTAPNVLFRFGVAGAVLYYMNFVVFPLRDKISGRLLGSLMIAVFIADCTANISESIKFMFVFAVVMGAILGRSTSQEDLARSPKARELAPRIPTVC